MDEGRNRTLEVEQGLQLDGCLGFAKRRPLEQTQTQIDGVVIQCVDRVLAMEAQVLVQIELSSAADQYCDLVVSHAQVARLVCVGQGGELNAVSKYFCVKFARVGSKPH